MRTLKVQGKGRVTAEPEIVILKFDLAAKSNRYEEALRSLSAKTDGLLLGLKSAGLQREQLKTSDFVVRTTSKYHDGKSHFTGFKAEHEFIIELPFSKQKLQEVLRHLAVEKIGAEIGMSFTVRDKEALRKKAMARAVELARENAEVLASAANVKLGSLVQMEYGWSEIHVYDRNATMLCEAQFPADYDPDIEPRDVSAEDNVTLVFEILD
ncbi:MAG: SIMPL domain-containing protein [Verrucomicrobia bacterium]|nr:SIMPL domain-containing protein [Verrucomicrobiota bacterium]MCH8510834.1 SIMPL domain-containing protein [Kiritimatiellia bacterium]